MRGDKLSPRKNWGGGGGGGGGILPLYIAVDGRIAGMCLHRLWIINVW